MFMQDDDPEYMVKLSKSQNRGTLIEKSYTTNILVVD